MASVQIEANFVKFCSNETSVMKFVVSNEPLVLFKSFVLLTVSSFLELHKKKMRDALLKLKLS